MKNQRHKTSHRPRPKTFKEVEALYYNGKPEEFISEVTEYLKKDYNIDLERKIYLHILRARKYKEIENYKMAIIDLDQVLNIDPENKDVMSELLLISYKLKKYKFAHSIIDKVRKSGNIDSEQLDIMDLVCKKNIHENIKLDREHYYDYVFSNIYEYDKDDALDYINDKYNDYADNVFNEHIDINSLFEEVSNDIKSFKESSEFGALTTYYVMIPNIGRNGENYLKTIVVPNTFDLLDMYPVKECNNKVNILNCNYSDLLKPSKENNEYDDDDDDDLDEEEEFFMQKILRRNKNNNE